MDTVNASKTSSVVRLIYTTNYIAWEKLCVEEATLVSLFSSELISLERR